MTGILCEDQYTFIIISSSVLLIMRIVSDKSFRVNKKTCFMFSKFFRKLYHLWYDVEKYCRAEQATDDFSKAYACCMLDNKGYKHPLKICNTYCFSMAMMVA